MNKEVIILAGGLGTRLSSVVADVPKCMAVVAGKPFLEHLLSYLETQFVDHVVLSLGYKHEVVVEWLKAKAFTFKVSWVIESSPLGTGGAVALALKKTKQQQVFVMNGDTFYPVSLQEMAAIKTPQTPMVVALKPMEHFDRYGVVTVDAELNITSFEEKRPCEKGLINGGVYLMDRSLLANTPISMPFSFEKQVLEKTMGLKASIQDIVFIDIGVPSDYEKAQMLLA